jgi:hypothetical protein
MDLAITVLLWGVVMIVFSHTVHRWHQTGINDATKRYEALIRRTFYLDDQIDVISWLDSELVNQTNKKFREEAWSLVCAPEKYLKAVKEDENEL